jgi:xanthine dehydrogenase molybdenum-binding subunit
MSTVLGKDHIKKDIALKVTGKAIYTGDINLPGILECRVLKSPYAHAKILSIDTTEAENLPGVRAVVTHKDNDILLCRPFVIGMHNDFYALPPEAVYMAGEQVAAVAAETKEIAQEAIKLIKVVYEPLPAVFDPIEAIKPGAPVLYPDLPDNKAPMYGINTVRRDIDRGFKDADVILESRYRFPVAAQCPLEPYQAVAKWDGDRLTVWIASQELWKAQEFICQGLGIPTNKITCIAPWLGGGFGGKYGASHAMLACLAAALAKKAGRPVRSLLEMDESFIVSHHTLGPGYYDIKGGIKRDDGRPVARDTVVHVSEGGHNCHVAANVVTTSSISMYRYDNLRAIGYPAMCNLNLSGPKRSYGDNEGQFGSEQFVDELAEAVGMDPLEWRRKWCSRPGDPCSFGFHWGELAGGNYEALMTKATEAFGWKEKWQGWKKPTAVNGAKRRGVGMALSMHITGFASSGTLVRINHDGTVDVNCTSEDMGQGIKSATAICVAEVLGVRYEDVSVAEDNTTYNPTGGGCYGSKGTPVNIGASINAARNAKAILLEKAAVMLEVKPEDLDVGDGKVFVRNQPDESITIGEAVGPASPFGTGIVAHGQETIGKINPDTGQIMWEKNLGAVCCEVEVDTETGAVEIVKMVMAADCGVVINPEVALGQIDSGVIMGLGSAMYEDIIFDKSNEGIVINPNLTDYKLPTFPEFGDFTSIVHSDPADAPTTPFNVKGLGESTMVAIAPAIANAIYNATGARVKHGPLTPDKVLAALGKIGGEQDEKICI